MESDSFDNIRAALIRDGVAKVRDLGFQYVNENNIFFDEVYSMYFQKMLDQKMGINTHLDTVIKYTLNEIHEKISNNS